MQLLSNLRIAKKLALVLGAIVLLMTCLASLALWGTRTIQNNGAELVRRLKQARQASDIASDTSTAGQTVAKMVLAAKATPEDLDEIEALRAHRKEALGQFQAHANTPGAIADGKDMEDVMQSIAAAGQRVIDAAKKGRGMQAVMLFPGYSQGVKAVYKKAKEVADRQEAQAAELELENQATASTIWLWLIAGSLAGIVGALFGGLLLGRSIATPLAEAVVQLDEIAQGDLSQDISAQSQARGDEIGVLARAMETMTVSLRKMVQDFSGGIQVLSASSTALIESSDQMTVASRNATEKASSVSAAAEQMSSNAVSVAAGMEQTTTNLGHVSTATDQMTSTIGEIASNSEKARRITEDATRQANRITEQINELGRAANEIGKVTETITEISTQTDLLALNATIEAARAGAAGKGFAVVANEIKALAQETAAATEDIRVRIGSVQSSTSSGIAEIGKISSVIAEVSAIVNSIAAAIEEQAASTKDIARNIAEASTGVADANTRVAETSLATKEIARDTVEVNGTAREMAAGSDRVRGCARDLSHAAETLQLTLSRFHV